MINIYESITMNMSGLSLKQWVQFYLPKINPGGEDNSAK